MKQTIDIEVPDGKKAVWKDGKLMFEDIKTQLPKTWKQFCLQNKVKEGECFIGATCYIRGANVDERSAIFDRNILTNKHAAEQHLALMQLHQLRDCYRQGWTPYYSYQSKNPIWYIAKYHDAFTINFSFNRVSFLAFNTRELSEQFLTNFKDLIEQAGDLI